MILASKRLEINIIKELLHSGAQATFVDESGKTAFDAALTPNTDSKSLKNQELVLLILQLYVFHQDPTSFFSLLPHELIYETIKRL